MKKKTILPVVGIFILISIYIFYTDKENSKPRVECIIQPEQTVINLYEGDKLIRSTGFGASEILDWYKGKSDPVKHQRYPEVKEFKTINPEHGIFTYEKVRPNFYYSKLISKKCYEAIP